MNSRQNNTDVTPEGSNRSHLAVRTAIVGLQRKSEQPLRVLPIGVAGQVDDCRGPNPALGCVQPDGTTQ